VIDAAVLGRARLGVALSLSAALIGCASKPVRIKYGYAVLGHYGPVEERTFTVDANCKVKLQDLNRLPRTAQARADDCARLFASARRAASGRIVPWDECPTAASFETASASS
jgi:hypothetical protein